MMRLVELRRGYAMEDGHAYRGGPVSFDRVAVDSALTEWRLLAELEYAWVDPFPVVTRVEMPALRLVSLTVTGFARLPRPATPLTQSLTHSTG